MSWRLRVVHRTAYAYSAPVLASYNEARLTPVTDLRQTTMSSALDITPTVPVQRYWDYWGTQVSAFDVQEPHERLVVTATSVVDTGAELDPQPVPWERLRTPAFVDEHAELLAGTGYVPAGGDLEQRGRELAEEADPLTAARTALGWTHAALRYVPGVTAVHTSAPDALAEGAGVCQDYAHVALALLRGAGIPARYVSGYLHPSAQAEVGVEVVGQSHAWVEVRLGDWWGWDPTNDVPVGRRHVLVARGRDYGDVPPLRGLLSGGGSSTLDVRVEVTRLS